MNRTVTTGIAALALTFGNCTAATLYSNDTPNNLMAMATRPSGNGNIEIESADDFVLNSAAVINSVTFTGLLTGGAAVSDIGQVVVEMYRVFPKDSDTGRTPNVPTRTNSPSDVAFQSRDSSTGELTFAASEIAPDVTALNSVLNGINPKPNQTTGGEGSVTGTEVHFTVNLVTPMDLPADHYFFIPQVLVNGGGQFYWLSASRPVFTGDLQTWIRNQDLAPDWLRVGTDIVGGTPAPTFNAAFSISGAAVPEPSSLMLLGGGLAGLAIRRLSRHS